MEKSSVTDSVLGWIIRYLKNSLGRKDHSDDPDSVSGSRGTQIP